MEESNGAKLTGIKQFVRLKEILQKWQSVSIGSNSTETVLEAGKHTAIISPVINKGPSRHQMSLKVTWRFMLDQSSGDLSYLLSHSLFKVLLEKAEEEYGFDHIGALTIPSEVETFKFLLKCIENHHPKDDDISAGDSVETEE